MSPLDIELATMSLVHVLQDAEEGVVVRPRPSRSRLKPQPHAPDIAQALKNSRVLFSAWKNMGRRAPSRCVTRKCTHRRGSPAHSSVKIEPAREKHLSRTSWMHIVVTSRYSTNWSTANAQDLAIPSNNDNFNTDHLNQVEEDMAFLDRLVTVSNRCNVTVTKEETHRAFKKLRVGKAADNYGLTAEHLLHAGEVLIPVLAWMFSAILTLGTIPSVFQKGLTLTSTEEAQQTAENPYQLQRNNHHLCNRQATRTHHHAANSTNIQIGTVWPPARFHGRRCSTLCFIHALWGNLWVPGPTQRPDGCTAEKAFDRVSHDGLFRKLAALQIPMECWMVLRDWYIDLNNTVKWNGTLSHTFPIHQGTLQGSVISPHAYKINGNDALVDIQSQHIGAIIGTVCCAAPTCADDVALIASTESGEISTLLNTIETHANMDRLTINSSKSVVLQYPAGRKTPSVELQINGCVLDSEPTATLLGVLQGAARTINTQRIGTRTIMATRTMYALFVQGCMADMVIPHGVGQDMDHLHYTVQSSGASTTQTQTFWRSSSGID